MRISDWSSDVCSSDLLFQRGETRCIARQYRDTVAACGETPGHSRARPGADPCNERKRPALDVRGRRRLRVGGSGHLRGNSRSEEHTSELQSLMRISYAVFCLKKKTQP